MVRQPSLWSLAAIGFQPRGASGHPWSKITGDPSCGPPSSKAISRSSVRIVFIALLQSVLCHAPEFRGDYRLVLFALESAFECVDSGSQVCNGRLWRFMDEKILRNQILTRVFTSRDNIAPHSPFLFSAPF